MTVLAIWMALCGLAAFGAPAAASTASDPAQQVPSQIVARFRVDPGSTAAAVSVAEQALGGDQVASATSLGLPGTYLLTLTSGQDVSGAVARLAQAPGIRYAEPNRLVAAPDPPANLLDAVESPAGNWGLTQVNAPSAWSLADGSSIIVADLGSGVSPSDPDLAGRILPGWNFVSGNADTADDAGHGTYVAGIIAARRGGTVTGVAPGAEILPVKVLDSHDQGSTANFVAGISYAVGHGARVINISADGIDNSQALRDALADAESHNVVVVASAGNTPDGHPNYPAALPAVLAVSASAPDDTVAPFSSYGPWVDLAAPGVDVESDWWSATSGDGTQTASGTSAAAPFVAGAATLVLSANPSLSAAQVRQLLEETAVDIGTPGIDAQSGHGRLDAYLATRLAKPVNAPAAGRLTLSGDGTATRLHFDASGFATNEPVALWVTSASGVHDLFHDVSADSQGTLSVDLGPLSVYPEGELTATAVGASGAAASANYNEVPTPLNAAFQPIPAFTSTADRLYFPQTGHSLSLGFKAYWEAHGGLAVFGYPISEEFTERNPDTGQLTTVQYFERERFEYHPELKGTPAVISLGRLGVELAGQTYPTAPTMSTSSSVDERYFPQTQHTLSGPFLDYWNANGGLALFGYPISEPFEEGGYLVQYFERARFEYHPELAAPYQVLLSRLGVALARHDGYLQ